MLTFVMAALVQQDRLDLNAAIDSYLNNRFGQTAETTAAFARRLELETRTPDEVEAAILNGPHTLLDPGLPRGEMIGDQPLALDHSDYTTSYFIYVPKSYDPAKRNGVILVGHGGNSAMSRDYARRTAQSYLSHWTKESERHGWVVAAPLTERGWGWYGDSIIFSLLSKLTREFNIDPNRVYLTGHSMGGHLTWRSSFGYPDRWAAVSPMSGGYDFVERGLMPLLYNVSGYVTHGATEPYEIADFNRKMKGWLDEREFDWVMDERPGGHEIYDDRLPLITDFFAARTRIMYPATVYAQHQGMYQLDRPEGEREEWGRQNQWYHNRPIDRTTTFWLRLNPEPDTETAADLRKAFAEIKDRKHIAVTAENVKEITLYLHPKMVDFGEEITITINGEAHKVTPSAKMSVMLEEVRRFDDRGRIFWDSVVLPVTGSQPVEVPSRSPRMGQ